MSQHIEDGMKKLAVQPKTEEVSKARRRLSVAAATGAKAYTLDGEGNLVEVPDESKDPSGEQFGKIVA